MVLIKHNYLKSDILYLFQVFQGPGPGSRVRVSRLQKQPTETATHSCFKKSKAAVSTCSSKQVVLIILQYSKENMSLFLTKLQVCNFPVNIAKILRTAFFIKHLRWLLLKNSKIFQENISDGGVIDFNVLLKLVNISHFHIT